jgi:Dna[CI] antecedent, DciA
LHALSPLRYCSKGRLVEKAGSLLTPLLRRLGINEDVRLHRIRNDWHILFEKPLSVHMSPSKLFEGDLLLSVDSPVWMQQLGFCKKEILKKLNAYGVKDVRFRIGRVFQKSGRDSSVCTPQELSPEENRFISDLGSGIEDEMLRESICRAMEKSFLKSKARK